LPQVDSPPLPVSVLDRNGRVPWSGSDIELSSEKCLLCRPTRGRRISCARDAQWKSPPCGESFGRLLGPGLRINCQFELLSGRALLSTQFQVGRMSAKTQRLSTETLASRNLLPPKTTQQQQLMESGSLHLCRPRPVSLPGERGNRPASIGKSVECVSLPSRPETGILGWRRHGRAMFGLRGAQTSD
jgi:hypothetical protein